MRRYTRALEGLTAIEIREIEKFMGKWRCGHCAWIGDKPVPGTETWELENCRGVTPQVLERVCNCPECGGHAARLQGDTGRPIPKDYPLPGFAPQGPCAKCGSNDTIPILRGYPNNEAMLAASRGLAKLGGCIIIRDEQGNGPASRSCKACGTDW